jgi:hypothetical protein
MRNIWKYSLISPLVSFWCLSYWWKVMGVTGSISDFHFSSICMEGVLSQLASQSSYCSIYICMYM